MQFQVPQFLDIEDKVIGPMTFKQFLFLGGGLGFGYLSIRFIPIQPIAYALAFLLAGFGGLLAFYRFNNRPFIALVESAFNFVIHPRLFIWKRREKGTLEADLANFRPTKTVASIAYQDVDKLDTLSVKVDIREREEAPVPHGHQDFI